MDLLDVATYFTLEYRVKRYKKNFLKANSLYDSKSLQILMWIYYIMHKRGGYCYDADIAHYMRVDGAPLKLYSTRIKLHGMMRFDKTINYVRSEKLHSVLKRRYIITEHGLSVLDNYSSCFIKEDKDITYLLKRVHIEADENKERVAKEIFEKKKGYRLIREAKKAAKDAEKKR